MYTIFSNISLRVTKSERNPNEILAILKRNQSFRRPFSTLTVTAFRKCTSQNHIFVTKTIHNNEKIIKTKNEHYTGKCNPKVVFSFNNLCEQKHSKVIKPIKRLKSTIKSTAEASFVIY